MSTWETARVFRDDDGVVTAVMWATDEPYEYAVWRLGNANFQLGGRNIKTVEREAVDLINSGYGRTTEGAKS